MKLNIEDIRINIKGMIATDFEATKLFIEILEAKLNGDNHPDIESVALVDLMTRELTKEGIEIFLKLLNKEVAEYEKMQQM